MDPSAAPVLPATLQGRQAGRQAASLDVPASQVGEELSGQGTLLSGSLCTVGSSDP